MISRTYQKWIYCLYLHFIIYKYLKYGNYFNLGKTVLYLICNSELTFWGVKRKNGTASVKGANKKLVLHVVRLGCSLLSITIPVSLLANELDLRSVLHGQVSLAAVNQIYFFHEAMNGCKKSKDALKACFENVNIYK